MALALALVGCTGAQTPDADKKRIAITAIAQHPSLDAIHAGVLAGLAEEGYTPEVLDAHYQSAQGSPATAGQIASSFAGESWDAIVAISTPSAQSMAAKVTSTPLVYTAVSDPKAAKLIDANGKPLQANVTGLSSELPLTPQLDLIRQIAPDARRLGFIYSSGEANSIALRNRLIDVLSAYNMILVDVAINRPSEVADATRSLKGRADVLFTSMDNGVASGFEAMAMAADEIDLPIVASDEFSVKRGAAAALGVNDFAFGQVTGKMVAQILDGTPPSNVAPSTMNDLTLWISPNHAKAQGIQLEIDRFTQTPINIDLLPN